MTAVFKACEKEIKKYSPNISISDLETFIGGLSISNLNAKEFYIKSDTIQHNIGFIHSGLVRAFYIDDKGNEVTVNFIKTNTELFNRISLTDLSSYLGIERQTLTRIRKKLLPK